MKSLEQCVQDHPLHVRLSTEFSGACTAEFALQAVSNASDGKISAEMVSSADWGVVPQRVLKANAGEKSHVFQDIASIMTNEMKERIDRMVPVQVLVSKADVLKAVGSAEYMGSMVNSSDSEGGVNPPPVEGWSIDGLFRRGKKKKRAFSDYGGMIKCRLLGTALKDYILVKEAS